MEPLTFLRLYVNPNWKRPGLHSPLLYPFWGNPNEAVSLFAKEMFDSYHFDTSLYAITDDLKTADMVFPPYRHNWLLQHDPCLLKECETVAASAGLPLFIDGVGDVEFPVTFQNSYVLRIGGYRFLPERGRIQIPPAADDLLERCAGGKLQLREKSAKMPVVGFAGWARLSALQAARTILKEAPTRLRGIFDSRYRACSKGVFWRARAIRVLASAQSVTLNLRVRGSFSGSAKTAEKDLRILRQEFVDTVLGSDFGLDVRGDANDSTRLFEILSLGRIPVLVDTERNLPFSDIVDYDSFCLRVDFRDLDRLPERVADFYGSIAPERFMDMQCKAREAFVAHFRIDALMRGILWELNRLRKTASGT